LDVTKPELGTKRRCVNCETKFFDLNKDPIVCPKCSAVFAPPQPDPVRPRRVQDRRPTAGEQIAPPNASNELNSFGEASSDAETEAPSAEAKKADGNLDLLDDQDENFDAADEIDADIEKDDV
jgi:uncharacterized protein (TIGR02300 family)